MAEEESWDADAVQAEGAPKKTVELDNWDDEDIDDDIKDDWDEEGEELKKEQTKADTEKSEKKSEKKEQEELNKTPEENEESAELTPEEGSEPDVKQAKEATGVAGDSNGIDAMSPCSKDDFGEFEKVLKDKLCPFEKSVHYTGFLESLFQDLCIPLEIEDLKKINSSITVLLGEKQKQEKQLNKGKKKKKGVVTAGGLKAKMKDDLADYGQFEGGYTQDYEDFM